MAMSGDRIGRIADDGEDLVPFALDGREHGIGTVRQSARTHDGDRIGDGVGDRVTGTERCHRESQEHGTSVAERPLRAMVGSTIA